MQSPDVTELCVLQTQSCPHAQGVFGKDLLRARGYRVFTIMLIFRKLVLSNVLKKIKTSHFKILIFPITALIHDSMYLLLACWIKSKAT